METASQNQEKPKPIIILTKPNPWLDVIGSDSPSFVLYDSGQVIFLKAGIDKQAKYFSLTLTPEEKEEFLACLPLSDFLKLKDHYTNFPEGTLVDDAPQAFIYVSHNGIAKRVTVEGGLDADDKNLPEALMKIYSKIGNFNDSRARPWAPEKYEVMIWPFENSELKPIKWPEGWPDLNSPDTKKRRDEQYSIYLKPAKFAELDEIMKKAESGQAVLINGKKWAVSYRIPFPHE